MDLETNEGNSVLDEAQALRAFDSPQSAQLRPRETLKPARQRDCGHSCGHLCGHSDAQLYTLARTYTEKPRWDNGGFPCLTQPVTDLGGLDQKPCQPLCRPLPYHLATAPDVVGQ